MEFEGNSEQRPPQHQSQFFETGQLSNTKNLTAKKHVVMYGVMIFLLLIAAAFVSVAFLFNSYNGRDQAAGNDPQMYTTDLYTIELPKSWIAYDVKAVDTQLQSILIIPPEAASLIQQSTTSPLESSYDTEKELEEGGHAYIRMGGAYIYVPYVPIEQRREFFEQWISRSNERSNSDLQMDSEIKTVNEKLVLLSKYQNNGRTIETATWFAKPDPHGRDRGADTVVVTVEYNAPLDFYDERLFQQLILTADDSIYAKYLEGVAVPEKINPTGIINSEKIFNSTSSLIVSIAVPKNGQKVLFRDFVGLSLDEFPTILRVLDVPSNEITTLNLLPFTSRLEIDTDAIADQQVFSPDGSKMLLHYDVGIKSPNVELSGQEGFAVFDLNSNNLHKLIPTGAYRHIQSFRTENGIGGGYANLSGWVNDHEIIYTCNTRQQPDRTDSREIPYDDLFITYDEVEYCVIDIVTLEHRVAEENKMVLSTYTNEMLEQSTTPFFSSNGSDCVNIGTNQCLRIVNGSIYFDFSDQTLIVDEGYYNSFLGWKSDTYVYLLVNEVTLNGQESSLIKFKILPEVQN